MCLRDLYNSGITLFSLPLTCQRNADGSGDVNFIYETPDSPVLLRSIYGKNLSDFLRRSYYHLIYAWCAQLGTTARTLSMKKSYILGNISSDDLFVIEVIIIIIYHNI
jgi:thiamine kinase-like enzyme